MLVLGIDPGLSRCGYGVVEVLAAASPAGVAGAEAVGGTGRRTEAIVAGVIRTAPKLATPQRLARLQTEIVSLISEHRPDVVALERVFFTANANTAMGVAQAAGLVMAAGVASGAEVVEYTPNQVKIAVAGWGAAPKEQVQRMVQALLHLPEVLKPADAADAVAVALCHLAHSGLGQTGSARVQMSANVVGDVSAEVGSA